MKKEYGQLFLICFLLDRRNHHIFSGEQQQKYDRPWTQMVTPNEANKQDKTVKSEPRLLASVTCNTDKHKRKDAPDHLA